MCNYHYWGAIKKVMDIFKKTDGGPEVFRLVENVNETKKPGNLHVKYNCKLNRKVWVAIRRDNRRRDEVSIIELDLLFRKYGKNL